MNKFLLIFLFLSLNSWSSIKHLKDGQRVILEGYVEELDEHTFVLVTDNPQIESEIIEIEVDSPDGNASTKGLDRGDKVVVIGNVDDDFLEKAKIEAEQVYIERTDTIIYADPVDEEDRQLSPIEYRF